MKRLPCLLSLAIGIALAAPLSTEAQTRPATPAVTIRSGPMLGYSEMREVMLWAQTTGAAEVHFVYWDSAAPGVRHRTAGATTTAAEAFTTRQIADRVEPGRVYMYEVMVNGRRISRPYPLRFQTQKLWQWREEPPAFRIALGSCAYVNEPEYDRPGEPYGGGLEIFTSIVRAKPDAMLWLGDNVYLREADWYTRTGILARYTHTRSIPELQPLLASTHHYATWDDHDFGPDNSDRSWIHKDASLEAFKLFWGNPTYGVGGKPGVTTMFQWADVEFFLLDDRYYRTPNDRKASGRRTMLGEHQFQWIIDALTASRAPFKIVAVGGQMMSPMAEFENFATYAEERQALIDAITAEKIPGVVFLSGDRHLTELTRLEREGTYPLYDITISPLSAGAYADGKANAASVPGTLVTQRNFALLDFSGPRTDRSMKISVHDTAGALLWTRTITARELR
jgi:alkaline phosphatase D